MWDNPRVRTSNGNIGKGVYLTGFASLLRSIRVFKELSLREMAVLLRVPLNTYWRAESGSPVVLSTAQTIVRRIPRWKLPADQAAKLQAFKERILQ